MLVCRNVLCTCVLVRVCQPPTGAANVQDNPTALPGNRMSPKRDSWF